MEHKRNPLPLQAAPVPWVPSDAPKAAPMGGDSAAMRGTSTWYNAAQVDPGKVPICSHCHINIR